MSYNSFFNEQEEQSFVKATIVTKYFWAWAKIMTERSNSERIAYIDLFAGPGRYKDGSQSTPLMILQTATEDEKMCKKLVTVFNDKDENSSRSLETEISKLKGIERLKYKPEVHNQEVGENIVKTFEDKHLVPTLIFVDPWGYKGLSLRLVNSVLKDWGCEAIFFFNYNRIRMGLNNDAVKEHMVALFGERRAEELRSRLSDLTSDEAELTIVEELSQALKEMGGKYVLPFRFRDNRGNRTSHHLIFVSKHILGYEIMKDIMAAASSSLEQGVASFEYNPATERQPLLFELTRPLDDLGNMLLDTFAGQRIKMRDIYDKHHIGKPYINKNYKQVLAKLEAEGKIIANPPADKRRMYKGERSFGDDVVVTFPARRT